MYVQREGLVRRHGVKPKFISYSVLNAHVNESLYSRSKFLFLLTPRNTNSNGKNIATVGYHSHIVMTVAIVVVSAGVPVFRVAGSKF